MDLGRPERRDGYTQSENLRGAASDMLAHLDAAYNLARWLVGREQDAQDIVQEAYLRALRSVETFRGGDMRSWILAIVRNASFDWLRRDKSRRLDEMDDQSASAASDEEADPSRILERAEDVARIRKAIGQLPAESRQMIVLREMEGLSYKEIADVSGVPIGTVMSRLARARRRLAELLSGEGGASAEEAEE